MSDPSSLRANVPEEQRQRALALLAKSLKKRPPSEEERAREERDYLKSVLALTDEAQVRSALRDRLAVLRAQARAQAGIGASGAQSANTAPDSARANVGESDHGGGDDEDEVRVKPMQAILEAWRDGDFSRAPAELLEPSFWRAVALGQKSVSQSTGSSVLPPPPPPGSSSEAAAAAWRSEAARLRHALSSDGFAISLPSGLSGEVPAAVGASHPFGSVVGSDAPSGWGWGAPGAAALGLLAAAAERLAGAGWPPVFVFMLDEAWAVAEGAWPLLAHALADETGDSSADECGLDTSVFCWIARRDPSPGVAPAVAPAAPSDAGASRAESAAGPPPGANFGTPHRDFTALESLRASDGAPALLSAWVPLTDVSSRNGAMSVLPREFDPLFAKRWAYGHMRPGLHEDDGVLELRFDLAGARQLAPLPAGALLAWCGNTVHWGGRCSAREPRPRVALGFNFVRDGVQLQSGRPPLRRAELRAPGGLSTRQRLSIVAGSLLLYANWYELSEAILPPGAVLPEPRAQAAEQPPAVRNDLAPAVGKAPAGAAPLPMDRLGAAGGMPAAIGVRANGQPQYLPDSVRQALYAKYGDISAVKGDPKDLEGNCATQ